MFKFVSTASIRGTPRLIGAGSPVFEGFYVHHCQHPWNTPIDRGRLSGVRLFFDYSLNPTLREEVL